MNKIPNGAEERASRIDEILLDALQRRMSGEVLLDDELIAKHPDLMPEAATPPL